MDCENTEEKPPQKPKPKRFPRVRLWSLLLILAYLIYYIWPGPPITGSYPPELASYFEGPFEAPEDYPPYQRRTYTDLESKPHVYLVQEPAAPDTAKHILVYMHGGGGNEHEGMNSRGFEASFTRLRALLTQKEWIYITPRDYEYDARLFLDTRPIFEHRG